MAIVGQREALTLHVSGMPSGRLNMWNVGPGARDSPVPVLLEARHCIACSDASIQAIKYAATCRFKPMHLWNTESPHARVMSSR
jgi:hypothetical protein